MKIALAQTDAVEGNSLNNIQSFKPFIEEASSKSVDLIVFPELATSGYYLNTINDNLLSSDEEALVTQYAKSYSIDIIVGLPRMFNCKVLSSLVLFSKSGDTTILYDKIHLFPGEATHFSHGDTPSVFSYKNARLGLSICYDLRFPELYSFLRSQDANLILVSAAWPQSRIQHWISLLQARAIETQSYVVAVNRCGVDDKLVLGGNSMIISPLGDVIEQAAENPTLLISDIDFSVVNKIRAQFQFYSDRRLDIYCNFY